MRDPRYNNYKLVISTHEGNFSVELLQQIYTFMLVIFSDTTVMIFAILILAIFVNVGRRWQERQPMRPISAIDQLRRMSGTSIEADQPLHLSLGSATVGDETTVLSLLSSDFLYQVARTVAIGDTPPLFTVSDGTAIPLAMDTLRRAYQAEARPNAVNRFNFLNDRLLSARWYPSGKRSLAFAAALMTVQQDDQVAGNVLLGRYGIELGLILDAAYRHDHLTVASSDQLDGQAIAYGLANDTLIGEEVFAAAAYLSDDPQWQSRNFAIDRMRNFVTAAIIILVIVRLWSGG